MSVSEKEKTPRDVTGRVQRLEDLLGNLEESNRNDFNAVRHDIEGLNTKFDRFMQSEEAARHSEEMARRADQTMAAELKAEFKAQNLIAEQSKGKFDYRMVIAIVTFLLVILLPIAKWWSSSLETDVSNMTVLLNSKIDSNRALSDTSTGVLRDTVQGFSSEGTPTVRIRLAVLESDTAEIKNQLSDFIEKGSPPTMARLEILESDIAETKKLAESAAQEIVKRNQEEAEIGRQLLIQKQIDESKSKKP